jgi:hypothetical protein
LKSLDTHLEHIQHYRLHKPEDDCRSLLKQVLKVQVLLVRHVLQTILAVDFPTSLMELVAHGKILKGSWKSGCFTLISLLLLNPSNVRDLGDDNYPEDDPDNQDSLESIDLEVC